MLLCVIQIRSKTWNIDLLIKKKKKKLLNVLVMKHGTPGSIGCLLSILLTSQLARLGNQTSLIIINKYSKCSTKVFSFEHHMKRLTDEDSKYRLCHRKILYRARISLRLLSRPYLPWKHTLQKSMRNLKKMGQQNLVSKETTFTNCEAPWRGPLCLRKWLFKWRL